MSKTPQLYVALDMPSITRAMDLARWLTSTPDLSGVTGLKIGLELFVAAGPAGIAGLRNLGLPIFLDLKLHDIPNTVAGAMRVAARLGVAMVSVHASGGSAVIQAAVEGAVDGAAAAGVTRPAVLAVTVLTSLEQDDLDDVGQDTNIKRQSNRLACLANNWFADGIISSAHELISLRNLLPNMILVVAGIRPRPLPGFDDQRRHATPTHAVQHGANILVVGRPITEAVDPIEAARSIRAEMDAALEP